MRRASLTFLVLLTAAFPAAAAETYRVQAQSLNDPKAVFATVESVDVATARARIGGTIVELAVDEGDMVERGQVLARIGDEKLALQMNALNAQVAAAQAQQGKALEDLRRAQDLFRQGTVAKARLDEAKAASDVADNQLRARKAEQSVLRQQMDEGAVLAPAPGRVLTVPVTQDSVVMPGEVVSQIAADSYVLRLRLPERHARFLKVGDPVVLSGADAGSEADLDGRIRQIYPQIDNGRVVADADVPSLSGYFVGQRVRVWVSTDPRPGFVVPQSYLLSRFGVDYVRVQQADGTSLDVPVQKGQKRALPEVKDGIEILSGVRVGDVLIHP